MTYGQLSLIHLWTILPALALGLVLHALRKGTRLHRTLGALYMLLMVVTAAVSLFMPARIGPTLFGHVGFIHLFSVIVLWEVPMALRAARRGDIAAHRSYMVGLYFGGLMLAFALAFMPGRTLNRIVFG